MRVAIFLQTVIKCDVSQEPEEKNPDDAVSKHQKSHQGRGNLSEPGAVAAGDGVDWLDQALNVCTKKDDKKTEPTANELEEQEREEVSEHAIGGRALSMHVRTT